MLILEEVEQTIKEIVVEVLEMKITPEEIDSTQEGFLEMHGFGSIDALEVLLHIERKFDVEVVDEDLNADLLKSIRTLAEYFINHSTNKTY